MPASAGNSSNCSARRKWLAAVWRAMAKSQGAKESDGL
jgi:hypothetical protein